MNAGRNITVATDGYKLTHHLMYPEGTTNVYSYFESRTGATYSESVFFGLQAILKDRFLHKPVTELQIEQGKKFSDKYFGYNLFNEKMWQHIVKKHSGRLPVRIRAVPEGMSVPTSNVLMTIENTDPECSALTNHLETILSQIWYPITVATLSRKIKQMLKKFREETVVEANPDAINFQLHDFGYRGVSCVEQAAFGGASHLINFWGTDTIAGIELLEEYYNAADTFIAASVPASEHSVMTSLGKKGEAEMFKKLLTEFPKGIVSIVSDSYDIFNAAENICGDLLKDEILKRDGVLVIRPDSGDPVTTVVKLCRILEEKFGITVNGKNYKVLNPKTRLLWGDGVGYDGIYDILRAMKENGYSAENIVFGSGGGLLQKGLNRDTQRFAFKCSAQKRNNEWFDIHKDPIDTTKTSKKGKLALIKDSYGNLRTIRQNEFNADDYLEDVFVDGELVRDMTLEQVRKNNS